MSKVKRLIIYSVTFIVFSIIFYTKAIVKYNKDNVNALSHMPYTIIYEVIYDTLAEYPNTNAVIENRTNLKNPRLTKIDYEVSDNTGTSLNAVVIGEDKAKNNLQFTLMFDSQFNLQKVVINNVKEVVQ